MRIQPPPPEIGDDEGFHPVKDIFKLKELGQGMTNLIANVEDPLVIAFNGQWGSGKTIFLKQWAGELRNAEYPVIYFDAFENDYIEDAFAALAREIVGLAETQTGTMERAVDGLKAKAIGLGKLLLKSGVKIATKAAVRTATAGLATDKDITTAVAEAVDESGDIAARYFEEILSEPTKQRETVQTFRKALSDLPSLLSPPAADERQKPLVFIIDELDRCKPHFALELLERIKHFMSVANVHFVLGVHLAQLRNSVKAAYGSDIDAGAYLQKFINLTIAHVDVGLHEHERHVAQYIEHLRNVLDLKSDDRDTLSSTAEFLRRVCETRSLSLRAVERIFSHIAVCLAFTTMNHLRPEPIVGGLCVLKVIEPELFAKAKRGKLLYSEIESLFGFDTSATPEDELHLKRQRDWWQFCLLDVISSDLEEFGKRLYQYGIWSDRKTVLPTIANHIVDRLRPEQFTT